MAQVVDAAGKVTSSGRSAVKKPSGTGASALLNDLGSPMIYGGGVGGGSTPASSSNAIALANDLNSPMVGGNVWNAGIVAPQEPEVYVPQGSSYIPPSPSYTPEPVSYNVPPVGVANSFGNEYSPAPIKSLDNIFEAPSYNSSDEANKTYENFFKKNGLSEEDIDTISNRGSWFDVLMNNPATEKVTTNLGSNPFVEMDLDDLKKDINNNINSLVDSGEFLPPSNPVQYTTKDTIGDIHAIDDASTMDYDHLTAPWATGEAMQKYAELGMGGRDWWEYDPYANYLKADEQENYGFKSYLPDETSRGNMLMAQTLDAPSDIAGRLARSRELLTDYDINFDRGDEKLNLSGSDFDYRAPAYINNMRKLLSHDPMSILTEPKDGKLHGAPVSTMILEYELPDMDGSNKYVHGDLVDSRQDFRLKYDDGSTIDVPYSEYSKWNVADNGNFDLPSEYWDQGNIVGTDVGEGITLTFSDGQSARVPSSFLLQEDGSMKLPEVSYVPVEKARGFLPDDLNALNDNARKNGQIENAPVIYLPDMVMKDGTRLTWDEVQNIQNDTNEKNDSKSSVSYDFGPLSIGKPRRLSGEIVNDDMSINWNDMLNNAYDFTAGSIPISIEQFSWPLSVTQGLSKSMTGIDPGKYDALTDSDRYISAEPDENGTLKPSYSGIQQTANTAMNMLVPATESLAGPISGHSAIEWLSGKMPSSSIAPSKAQVIRNFLLGAAGEGMEEVVGNLFEEAGEQGEAAYGNYTDKEGNALVDENGEPVRDSSGQYKYIGSDGNPMTYMTDELGHVYRDKNTPLADRVKNFLDANDLANAFAGGVLVDTAMQLPVVGPALKNAARNDRIRKQTGLRQYVDTKRDEMRRQNPLMDVTEGDSQIDPEFLRMLDEKVYEE